MSPPFPVPIPYALTDAHRRKRTMGKVTVTPAKSRGRRDNGLLEQPLSARILLPILNRQPRFAPSHKSRRKHRIQVRKMAVAQAESRKKRKVSSAQERRDRVSKSNAKTRLRVSRTPQASQPGSQQLSRPDLWKNMIGPGTRLGGTMYAPIPIEDDEDEVVDCEDSSPTPSGFFSNSVTPSTPVSRPSSIYAPSPSTLRSGGSPPIRRSIPSRIGGALPSSSTSSTASVDGRYRESSIYVDTKRGTTASASPVPRSLLANVEDHTYRPCPPPHMNVLPASPHRPPVTAPPTPKSRAPSRNRQVITLADVCDAESRRKVSQLMAVAPALPVQDLLDLLLEAEGNLTAARASRAPSARPVIKSERVETAQSLHNARLAGYGYNGDEVMIKIEPNMDFLEYDTDSPPPEDVSPAKRCVKNKLGAKNTKQSSKPRAGVALKKSGPQNKLSRKARGNSIMLGFIDPDNVIHLDTDFSSSDTSNSILSSSSDTDMEDAVDADNVEDLTIDMRPRFAYNSAVLARTKKRL